MSNTQKPFSDLDVHQIFQSSYNDVNASISVDGFLTGEVGNQITLAISETTVANDTETYSFFNTAVQIYQIKIVYTDGTRTTMLSATRIS